MEQRLSIVTLVVEDLPRSRAFYEQLGWSAADSVSNDQVVFFQVGSLIFALYSGAALVEEVGMARAEGFGGITMAHNPRGKNDVDAVLAAAKEAGATIVKEACDVFWGGYSGYFKDPDGYLWEIAWNPFFEILEDGTCKLPD